MCTTVLSFRRGTKMFKSKAWPWIWYILKSEDFSMEDSDEEKKRVNSILKLDPRHNPGFERTVARSCHAPQKTPQPLSDRHGALWYTTTAQIQSLDKPTALLTMLHHPLLTAPARSFQRRLRNLIFWSFFSSGSHFQRLKCIPSTGSHHTIRCGRFFCFSPGWWLMCLSPVGG